MEISFIKCDGQGILIFNSTFLFPLTKEHFLRLKLCKNSSLFFSPGPTTFNYSLAIVKNKDETWMLSSLDKQKC